MYDGAGTYMGQIDPLGGLTCGGEPTQYKKSFLVAAADALDAEAQAAH